MNDINHLIKIIELNNGCASVDDICSYFSKNQHIVINSFHRNAILKVLQSNPLQVRLNKASQKWELIQNRSNERTKCCENEANFFYRPVNLNQWHIFDEISGVGCKSYFPATKKMKVGDYIIPFIGSQNKNFQSGVYCVVKIVSEPVILNNSEEYYNKKLAVLVEFISFSRICMIKSSDFSKYVNNQFRSTHIIDPKYNKELTEMLNIES